MTSRERLLAALECKKTDRVPISTYELCGYNSISFENIQPSYAKLMQAIREKTDAVTMWNPTSDEVIAQTAAVPDMTVKEKREGKVTTYTKTLRIGGRELTQVMKVEDDIITVWQVKHWCDSLEDVDAFLSLPYEPVTYDFSDYARISSETGEHGIIMLTLADPMCVAAELMSFGDYTVWALTEQEHFQKTLDKIHARNMQNYKRMLDTQAVDLYRIVGPEYCTPPYLPPYLFERYVEPYVKDITDLIHSYGKKVRIHSHGKVGGVLPSMLRTGADAVDPMEDIPDGDISLRDAKRLLQGKMCIFGNIELKMLEHATARQVCDYVDYCMDSAKDGYGFVIMPTASPINIPLSEKTRDNYLAFIERAAEKGVY